MGLTRRNRDMKLKQLVGLGLLTLALSVSAQVLTESDWQESEAPAPPAFSSKQLIPIEMPKYVAMRLGVDPATLSITPDGLVRYVVLAINANGSVSAMYEGIRCASAEVKTYARSSGSGPWSPVPDPQWRKLNDNLPSRHALALARQGLCEGRSPSSNSVAALVMTLRNAKADQYR